MNEETILEAANIDDGSSLGETDPNILLYYELSMDGGHLVLMPLPPAPIAYRLLQQKVCQPCRPIRQHSAVTEHTSYWGREGSDGPEPYGTTLTPYGRRAEFCLRYLI